MVAEYISSIKVAWDVAKALKVATDSIDDAHIKLQMADLISALADAKIEAAEHAGKIKELEAKLNIKASMSYWNGLYYREENGEKTGPFCPTCYDNNEKSIWVNYNAEYGHHHCKVCDNYHS